MVGNGLRPNTDLSFGLFGFVGQPHTRDMILVMYQFRILKVPKNISIRLRKRLPNQYHTNMNMM
jgi:hypothetical protein